MNRMNFVNVQIDRKVQQIDGKFQQIDEKFNKYNNVLINQMKALQLIKKPFTIELTNKFNKLIEKFNKLMESFNKLMESSTN